VLEIDLAALERGDGVRSWSWPPPAGEPRLSGSDVVGSWGGAALGLAVLAREAAEGRDDAHLFLVSAGDAVRRGLPTAARATVMARSPASGLLSEGQVGGDLGSLLAEIADVLLLRGRVDGPAVLTLRADGEARLRRAPELAGLDPVAVWHALAGSPDLIGPPGSTGSTGTKTEPRAVLSIGAGGERGLPFASLASGGERPSFVGRGGLGAVFGRLGLKALVVEGTPGEHAPTEEARALTQALAASPRLAARAAGGTFELLNAFAARGDLLAKGYTQDVPRATADALAQEAEERAVERGGCRGCPTPCGWVFERSDGGRRRAHFSASYALGTNLQLDSLDDSLHLLAACDGLAVDAKEVGALLALLARAREEDRVAGPALWGDADELVRTIQTLARTDPPAEPDDGLAMLRAGAIAFAEHYGLAAALPLSRGQVARPEKSYAAVLGQCVSSGGADPMRSFPFLVDAAGRARLESLCADLGPLPEGAEDPHRAAAKGRLVAWHEDLVSAVNATGFCAFSTAGLLADGLSDLDALAAKILPRELREAGGEWAALGPGARLLAAGANLVLLRRALDAGRAEADEERPAWARARLDEPGMLAEYKEWRGLDDAGVPLPERLAALGTPAARTTRPVGVDGGAAATAPAAGPRASGVRVNGRVELRAMGTLRDALGGRTSCELPLPATVLEVLGVLAEGDEGARRRLLDGALPIPTVWRAGARLAPESTVEAGDVLELVTAIGGG